MDPFPMIHLQPIDIDITVALSSLNAAQLALSCLLNPGEHREDARRAFRLLRERSRTVRAATLDLKPRLESIEFNFYSSEMGVDTIKALTSAQILILAAGFHPQSCSDSRVAEAASNEFFMRREIDIERKIGMAILRNSPVKLSSLLLGPGNLDLTLDLTKIRNPTFQEMSAGRNGGSSHRPSAAEIYDNNTRVEQAIDDLFMGPTALPTPSSLAFDSPSAAQEAFFQPRDIDRDNRRPSLQDTVSNSFDRFRETDDRRNSTSSTRRSSRRDSLDGLSYFNQRRSPVPEGRGDSRGFYSQTSFSNGEAYPREESRQDYVVKSRFEEVRGREGERPREYSYSDRSRSPPPTTHRRHRSPSPARSRMVRSRSRSLSPVRRRDGNRSKAREQSPAPRARAHSPARRVASPPRMGRNGSPRRSRSPSPVRNKPVPLSFRDRYTGSNFLSSIPLADQVPSSVVVSWSQLFLSNLPEFVTVDEIHAHFKNDVGLVAISQGSRKAIHSNSASWIAFDTEAGRDACLKKWTGSSFAPKQEVMFIVKGESGKRRREWPKTGWIGNGLAPLPKSDEAVGFRSDELELVVSKVEKIVEEK